MAAKRKPGKKNKKKQSQPSKLQKKQKLQQKKQKHTSFLYTVKALTHFRNQPVLQSTKQTVASENRIDADQLKGWFVKTYHTLFDTWPAPAEMASIHFPSLYPMADQNIPCFPPPMTILQDEEGKIKDFWGKEADQEYKDEQEYKDTMEKDEENLFSGKSSPLSSEEFISAKKINGNFCILKVSKHTRMRNRMGDFFEKDEENGAVEMSDSFKTRENGLFAQEYVDRGTIFGGYLFFSEKQWDFHKNARVILQEFIPEIKGTFFEQRLIPIEKGDIPGEKKPEEGKPYLVIQPVVYDPDMFSGSVEASCSMPRKPDKGQVFLETRRRYAPMWGRPRRNQVVIAAGSVLKTCHGKSTIPWEGFGNLEMTKPKAGEDRIQQEYEAFPLPDDELKAILDDIKMTRSQAGILRELLHPGRWEDEKQIGALRNFLAHQKEKSEGRMQQLYDNLHTGFPNDTDNHNAIKNYQNRIRQILNYLAVNRWERRTHGKEQ